MQPQPCRTCGYHSPSEDCAWCAHAPRDAALLRARARGLARFGEGFAALGHGLRVLLATPRTKRLLVPPFLLSLTAFLLAFAWVWSWTSGLLADLEAGLELSSARLPGLLRPSVEWLLRTGALLVSARLLALVVLVLAASYVFLWCFSIVYEAICGPFLDAVHARVEARWFGSDPRAGLDAERRGFWPRARRELGTWITSLKASLLALLILLGFLWVKLLPLVGLPLFALIAGFATALTLLDIPFSRRGWTLGQRLDFLQAHLPELVALGLASGLVFLVPILGPLVGVPAASVGGLWLFVRLDKSHLRTRGTRG